jgi:hypothetical protein
VRVELATLLPMREEGTMTMTTNSARELAVGVRFHQESRRKGGLGVEVG